MDRRWILSSCAICYPDEADSSLSVVPYHIFTFDGVILPQVIKWTCRPNPPKLTVTGQRRKWYLYCPAVFGRGTCITHFVFFLGVATWVLHRDCTAPMSESFWLQLAEHKSQPSFHFQVQCPMIPQRKALSNSTNWTWELHLIRCRAKFSEFQKFFF